MRVFARRERPHPGAQLTLFEAGDGWWYSLWATNRPAATKGWLGQAAYLDAAHRVQAQEGEPPGPVEPPATRPRSRATVIPDAKIATNKRDQLPLGASHQPG